MTKESCGKCRYIQIDGLYDMWYSIREKDKHYYVKRKDKHYYIKKLSKL